MPKPDWYNEGGGFLWSQLTGVFRNTASNSADHIDNCDGLQAAWLFAVPEVGMFQDYNSVDYNDLTPPHDFNSKYNVGLAYRLTVGVIGTGGGMTNGVTLELSLYYRDGASNKVTVASTSVTNLPSVFTTNTHLIDFTVTVPPVQSGDPWANQNIGVQFLSTVSSNLQGGYWDLDNVRLMEFTPPVLSSPAWSNGQFGLSLQSETGLAFEILAATNPSLVASNWTSVGMLTNLTGTVPFVDTIPTFSQRFYRARLLP